MENNVSISLTNKDGFELAQRAATVLSKSDLVPKQFQNNLPNCIIAINMANRIGADPLMVMQNLYIVNGKPSWSSTFLIAAINGSGKFKSPLRFDVSGEGDDKGCVAWAVDNTDDRLESPKITIEMAKKEGWMQKSGSKWQTMPELMMRYRAASFFSRLFCPEITMGMQSVEEIQDAVIIQENNQGDEIINRVKSFISNSITIEQLKQVENELTTNELQQLYHDKHCEISGKLAL